MAGNALIRFDTVLLEVKLGGSAVTDSVKLQVDDFNREVKMNITFEKIYDTSSPFEDMYDGYVGIQPWQKYPEKKAANFMWQLQSSGLIDHQVVMINTGKMNHSSVVKFGGWDTSSVENSKVT